MSNTCRLDSLLTPAPRPMGFGEAIEWMLRNPGQELVDSDGDRWHLDDSSFTLQYTRKGELWCADRLSLVFLALTFRIPGDHA